MSDLAIRAEQLSKRFTLNTQRRTTLKERFVKGRAPKSRDLWALKDASFEVERGEGLGIVGHNGAGKSTALKVITGIYRPTSGAVQVNGRVSALLELGAGFHPELTGRENIRLNGSILGLGKRQIEGMMDDIIDFSGIEDFIDSPVKIYSSGMVVRLGFAIVVKLDPDILIMDEVIAVGDEAFQRKCFEYLYDLRRRGCSVVLVSHSMTGITDLCERALWLDQGQVRAIGPAQEVTKAYLDSVNAAELSRDEPAETGDLEASEPHQARGSGEVRLMHLDILNADGQPTETLISREPATMRFHYRCHTQVANVTFGFQLFDQNDRLVAGRTSDRELDVPISVGEGLIDFHIPDLLLNSGSYRISTFIADRGKTIDARDQEFGMKVHSTDHSVVGYFALPGVWEQSD